jgi:dihydroneopterin aldolase
MKTKVSLHNIEIFAYHGYYPEERKAGNQFIIDTVVELKSFDSNDDNIYDTVNYEDLYNICQEEMQNTQKLLETVVLNIMHRYKQELNHITGAYVRLSKVGPQLGGKVGKAVVEMSY